MLETGVHFFSCFHSQTPKPKQNPPPPPLILLFPSNLPQDLLSLVTSSNPPPPSPPKKSYQRTCMFFLSLSSIFFVARLEKGIVSSWTNFILLPPCYFPFPSLYTLSSPTLNSWYVARKPASQPGRGGGGGIICEPPPLVPFYITSRKSSTALFPVRLSAGGRKGKRGYSNHQDFSITKKKNSESSLVPDLFHLPPNPQPPTPSGDFLFSSKPQISIGEFDIRNPVPTHVGCGARGQLCKKKWGVKFRGGWRGGGGFLKK